MSVIVRESSGLIKLYVKGADSVIKERLSKDIPQKFLAKTETYVENFSLKGLRTLLVAMKVLTEEEYTVIHDKVYSVIEATNRDDKISKVPLKANALIVYPIQRRSLKRLRLISR